MDPETATFICTQNVRAANAWNAKFEPFTILKLILRLITILRDNNGEIVKNSNQQQLTSQRPSDSLGYVQEQIANTVQQLALDFPFIRAESLCLRARAPILDPDLMKLVLVISVIAKLHVSELVGDALQRVNRRVQPQQHSATSNESEATRGIQIEARDIHAGIRAAKST